MKKDRLTDLSKAAGYKSLADFARAAGIEPGTAQKHTQRDSIPSDAAAKYIEAAKGTGATIDWLLSGRGATPRTLPMRAPPESPREVRGNSIISEHGPVVIFRSSAWEGGRSGGVVIYKNEKRGEVERDEKLRFAERAYAFEISEDLGDAYQTRDIVVVDPGSSVTEGDDCLFIRAEEEPLQFGLLRRLVRKTDEAWEVRVYGDPPNKTARLSRSEYPIAWRIRQRIMRP